MFTTDKKKGRKVISRRITVCGSGEFPFDMLRYDSCVPLHEADSHQMAVADGSFITLRSVNLVCYADTFALAAPTIGRWRSMGWRVTAIESSLGKLVNITH